MSEPRISGQTRVYGVIGYPIQHSLSPLMHNRAFAALGYPGVYVALPVVPETVGEAIAGVRALGIAGVNVTVPHKEAVMPFLDELTPAARTIGAVNTIVNRGGRLVGENTDGKGFLRSLQEELGRDPAGARVVLLGSGGAARAISAELLNAGIASLLVANRTVARATELVESLGSLGSHGADMQACGLGDPLLPSEVERADILIQTTSWGMAPHDGVPPLIPPEWLRPSTAVCDIVYTPAETSLLQAARLRGCPTLSGLGMLVFQGAIALELWTGEAAPVAEMRRVLEQHLYG